MPKEWLYLGIVCLAAIIVMLPIVVFGIPSGKDLPQHFQFANAYYESIVAGDGFPNWSSRENDGYGSIGIRFYPPFSYYALALARILTGSWFDAAWLTFMFWMALSCFGVFYWARWWLPARESAAAGIFYAFSTYHLNQLYVAFVYADFAGAAILPFCFAFLTRVFGREKHSDILFLAIAYAVLVLTHLPSAIIGSLSLAVYALILTRKKASIRPMIRASVAALLGLAASSYYWLTMVTEMSWLNHATERFSSGHYYFGNRFFPMYFHGIATDYNPDLLLSDILTLFGLLVFAAPLIYLFYRRNNGAESGPAAGVFRTALPLGLFAFFMVTPLSYPVWTILSPLQKIQFPMRWMAVVSMTGSILIGAGVYFLLKGNLLKQRAWSYVSVIFLSALLIVNFTYIWYPSAFVPIERSEFEGEMRELPERQNYEFWWAVWSKKEALEIKERVLAENRPVAIENWAPDNRAFTVAEGAPATARIATYYYPHWKAEVNGREVPVEKDEHGAMLVPLPAGESNVRLYFQEPPIIQAASVVSLVTWLLLISAFLFFLRERLALSGNPQPNLVEEEFLC